MSNELKMAKVQSILSLHAEGWTRQRIADALDIDRGTVSRYLERAAESAEVQPSSSGPEAGPENSKPAIAPTGPAALIAGPAASDASAVSVAGEAGGKAPISPAGVARGAGRRSECEPWREVIEAKAEQGLSAVRIHQDLVYEHQVAVSYDSVRRFLQHLVRTRALPFRRMECAPGEQLQVDFGQGAWVTTAEGKRRRPHLFRAILSYSRKGYSEASWRQTTEDFVRLLENAFWQFGGVPKTVVIDNLRAAVKQPDWYDPELNPKLESFCQHYGCVILPTKSYTPRHKGKTERGVGYGQDNALKARVFASLDEQNRHLAEWEAAIADTRIHGTTKKQVGKQFVEVERRALQPLPRERFPFFHEARRSVHRDGHVEVAKAYYSVPPEYVAREVWVRWDGRLVRVFNQRWEQIALHTRAELGKFSTKPEHIPREKISGVERGAEWLLKKVRQIGPESTRWAEAMLENRGIEGVRVLQGLAALAAQHPCDALERACKTAHSYQAFRLRILRELLKRQAPLQCEFDFTQVDPIIRPMSEYRDWLAATLAASAVPASGFQRHGKGVRGVHQEQGPGGDRHQGPSTSSTRLRSGYPSSGCSPAEPDSVSPDIPSVVPFSPQEKSP